MKFKEKFQNTIDHLPKLRFNKFSLIASLGILFMLASCSTPTVIEAHAIDTYGSNGYESSDTAGQFNVTFIGDRMVSTELIRPSTLCESENNRKIVPICNSIEVVADILAMTQPERDQFKGRVFLFDEHTFQSIYSDGAGAFAVPEFAHGKINGPGIIAMTINESRPTSSLAHEGGHYLFHLGIVANNSSGTIERVVLGQENIEEDKMCAVIENQTAKVCHETPDGTFCSKSSIPELIADTVEIVVASRANGCTSSNCPSKPPGSYGGAELDGPDLGSALPRLQTREMMDTLPNYFLDDPDIFLAWVEMLKNGSFIDSWMTFIQALGLETLPPDEAINVIQNLDQSIQVYSGFNKSPYVTSRVTSLEDVCR